MGHNNSHGMLMNYSDGFMEYSGAIDGLMEYDWNIDGPNNRLVTGLET